MSNLCALDVFQQKSFKPFYLLMNTTTARIRKTRHKVLATSADGKGQSPDCIGACGLANCFRDLLLYRNHVNVQCPATSYDEFVESLYQFYIVDRPKILDCLSVSIPVDCVAELLIDYL